MKISGTIRRGHNNSRVVFLRDGRFHTARVPNSYVPLGAFNLRDARDVRPATISDEGHILEQLTVTGTVRICQNNARVNGELFKHQPISARVARKTAVLNNVVEVERRFITF
jgi:hypothetical protein